ncbi:MAG: lipopolysaccharide biosynthesis protein [Burkholderiaceae bacterium]
MESTDRYGGAQVRKGLLHFLVGKALTSVAGIGTFVLLVRALPIDQFAAYSILFGLVELIAAITGVGITHVMARYIPEVYAIHLNATFRSLVLRLLALRFVVLAIVIVAMWVFAPEISGSIGLTGWDQALTFYLWVIAIRTVLLTLFTLLEQMLLQGIAQLSLSLVTVSRFVILAALWWAGMLDLTSLILVEILTDILGVVIMVGGLRQSLPARPDTPSEQDRGWIHRNRSRMIDFGWKGYLQHMLVLPFSGSTDRLIVGSQLASSQVALFGFGQWVLDLMNRYLPAHLLQGLIRPVLTARYARDNRFADVVVVTNLILKVNLALLAGFAVLVFAGGSPALLMLTGDKFGGESLNLLLLMTFLMALYSWRQVLDIAAHTVEKNGPLIWAHTVLILSVIPGVIALPWFGVYALPISHVIGVIVASFLLIYRLALAGFSYRMDWIGIFRLALVTGVSMGLISLFRTSIAWPWLIIAGGMVFCVLLALSRPINSDERASLAEIIKSRSAK